MKLRNEVTLSGSLSWTFLPSSKVTEIVLTTVAPNHRDSAVVGVVIMLVLCTLVGLVYLLYRYLCHNKGIYRTSGEAAPGVDPDQVCHDTVTENKEYFI